MGTVAVCRARLSGFPRELAREWRPALQSTSSSVTERVGSSLRDLPYVPCISVELYSIFWSLAVPVASNGAMLDGMCERAVTTYVLGSVWWSNKHAKSYSYPRARVQTDQEIYREESLYSVVATRKLTDATCPDHSSLRGSAQHSLVMAERKPAWVHLVLCRLAAEDISWAADAVVSRGPKTAVFVYNAGPPLQLPAAAAVQFTERKLLHGGHEAYCYLEHIQRSIRGGNGFAAATVFAPAQPRCADGKTVAPRCTQRLAEVLHQLSNKNASIEPNGYAPIEPAPIADFWQDLSQTLTCLPDQYAQLSMGRDLHTDSEFFSYSPAGAFAVARKNLLSAPRGWLRRAQEAMRNASAASAALGLAPLNSGMQHLCCSQERTCVPWLLERLWPMLLNTPHRGCNGVRTGYCATEWNPKHREQTGPVDFAKPAPRMAPREGAGAIKLRIDVARVARVARFANELSEEERTKFMDLIAAERPSRRKPIAAAGGRANAGSAVDLSTCTTQLCAILTLLDRARANDEEDFALYLAAAVNNTASMEAPERSLRRCRQLFVDKKVLVEGVERIQTRRDPTAASAASESDELKSGQLLHSAIQKVYAACLRQMDVDPRWYQRPFVYGFAKEGHQPLPPEAQTN